MIPLATIAGTSIGRSASRSAWRRDAPRSRAASSYSGPIASSRPRTMIRTKTSEKVMWPIACATVPSSTNVRRCDEDEEQRRAHHDLGRDERRQRDAARRPRAAAAPAREPDGERDAERNRDEHGDRRRAAGSAESAELRSGSWRTERSGSPVYQRSDQPWAVERDRPSLNEKRIAMRIGTIDQTR